MPFSDLPKGQAKVILADPAWTFQTYSKKGEEKSPQAQYDCMTLDAIKALPVQELADPAGCVLALWATAPMFGMAWETLPAWGFKYKTMGAWGKQSKTGAKLAFGTGFIYRSAAEFWLIGTIGKPKLNSRSIRNLIMAPVREHSRKPDQMHSDLEAMYDGPRIELFSRQSRPGWITWGNQSTKFDLAA